MASEKHITMKQFNGTDYDTLYPKTKAEQVEGIYGKDEILNNSTKALYGLANSAVPNDVLSLLSRFNKGLGNEYVWAKNKIEEFEDRVELADVQIFQYPNNSYITIYTGTGYINNNSDVNNPYALTGVVSTDLYAQTVGNSTSIFLGKYISAGSATWEISSLEKGVYYVPTDATFNFTTSGNSYSLTASKVTAIRNHRFVTTKYGYVNSPNSNAYPPSVPDGYTYAPLGQLGAKSNIATGTYTGTGTYGSSNTTKLTFSFEPKLVLVALVTNPSTNWSIFSSLSNASMAANTNYIDSVSFSGNTMTWYGSSAEQQHNKSGVKYSYVAFG